MARMKSDTRKQDILDTAYQMALTDGYFHLTAQKVAERVGCSRGLIPYYFGSFVELKKEIVKHAESENRTMVSENHIIAQARMMGEA